MEWTSLALSLPFIFNGLGISPEPVTHLGHEEGEHFHVARSAELATGNFNRRSAVRYPWPVEVLSIGHTIGSYQSYGALDKAYFHHGLDIRAEAGSQVRAAAGGRVVNIENYVPGSAAYWEIAILDDDGFLWQYHHIDRSSIPSNVMDAFKTGGRVQSGDCLGKVFYWSIVTFGERYHHIHLNVLGADKTYLNPFNFLEALADKQSPEINEIALFKNGQKVSGDHVSQDPYSVVIEVRDLILHDKFIVPPHEVRYRIDNGPRQVFWRFDSLPGGSSNEKHVNQFYSPPLACGNYSCRRPVMDLGFNKQKLQIFPTNPGPHNIYVEAFDDAGNLASQRFSWYVD